MPEVAKDGCAQARGEPFPFGAWRACLDETQR